LSSCSTTPSSTSCATSSLDTNIPCTWPSCYKSFANRSDYK
jgi:hypothetical protein